MATENLPIDAASMDEWYAKMAAQAAQIASIEVVTWVPIQIDDHVCGRIIDTGTIELPSLRNTGEIDIWPTNTVVPIGDIVMDGKPLKAEGKVLRLAWLGPVQLSHYQRTLPAVDDVVAMHYQSDQTPKSGLNDYKLVNCIVFDHNTGQVKKPQNVAFGTDRVELGVAKGGNSDLRSQWEADKNANHPLTPRDGEEPL